jgi:beta-lactamase class A
VGEGVEALLAPYLAVYGEKPPLVSVCWAGLDGRVRFDRHGDAVHVSASMMKIPVALEVLRLVDRGALGLDDEVPIRNGFPAALGGTFVLDGREDSDPALYGEIGGSRPVAELVHRMIGLSSNLATNLLLDLTDGPEAVTATAVAQAGTGTAVRRYICDEAAAQDGIANEMTAVGTARVLAAIGSGAALREASSRVLVDALAAQAFNGEIPAGLPSGTRVAHKTGWVEGVLHDGAVVWPPDGAAYTLAVFTSGFVDQPTAGLLIRKLSAMCWERGH